jgi:hypothetical protein
VLDVPEESVGVAVVPKLPPDVDAAVEDSSRLATSRPEQRATPPWPRWMLFTTSKT